MTEPKRQPSPSFDSHDAALTVAALSIATGCFLIAIPLGFIALGVEIIAAVIISASGLKAPKEGR